MEKKNKIAKCMESTRTARVTMGPFKIQKKKNAHISAMNGKKALCGIEGLDKRKTKRYGRLEIVACLGDFTCSMNKILCVTINKALIDSVLWLLLLLLFLYSFVCRALFLFTFNQYNEQQQN